MTHVPYRGETLVLGAGGNIGAEMAAQTEATATPTLPGPRLLSLRSTNRVC